MLPPSLIIIPQTAIKQLTKIPMPDMISHCLNYWYISVV